MYLTMQKNIRRITDPIGVAILDWLTALETAHETNIQDFEEKSPIIEDSFKNHVYFKWKRCLSTLILGALVLAISNNLQLQGLWFDGVGAFFLALSVVRGKAGIARDTREKAGRVTGGGVNIHREHLSSTVSNSVDGIFGAVSLLTGFLIQFISIWGIIPVYWIPNEVVLTEIILFILVISAIIFRYRWKRGRYPVGRNE